MAAGLCLAARNGIIVQYLHVAPDGVTWNTKSDGIERPGKGALRLPADFTEAQDQPPNPPGDEE